MLKITKVKRNSIAKEIGLEVGDEILAFDGIPCEDELDYLYYTETDGFSMTVRNKRDKSESVLQVKKAAARRERLFFYRLLRLS